MTPGSVVDIGSQPSVESVPGSHNLSSLRSSQLPELILGPAKLCAALAGAQAVI